MDGENNGKPYWNGWFEGTTIFGNTHMDLVVSRWVYVVYIEMLHLLVTVAIPKKHVLALGTSQSINTYTVVVGSHSNEHKNCGSFGRKNVNTTKNNEINWTTEVPVKYSKGV